MLGSTTVRRKNLLNHGGGYGYFYGGTSRPILPAQHHLQHHHLPDGISTEVRKVDLCIIGGGVSGLAAAISVAQQLFLETPQIIHHDDSVIPPFDILILESTSKLGGRVQSDVTSDGYTLDKGFAVFIEEYPMSRQFLDYDALGLQPFLPGAKVKLLGKSQRGKNNEDAAAAEPPLACVSDPIRRPRDILNIITSPVGSLLDKLRLAPLFYTIFTKSIEELFEMEESDTLSCLRYTYHFSEEFISTFFAPFLEGIYLAPLSEQSSRMFHFVMKMFTIGNVSLPKGGMQAVVDQLDEKARKLGVNIQLESKVVNISRCAAGTGKTMDGFLVEVERRDKQQLLVNARCVVVATDAGVANELIRNSSAVLGLVHATNNKPVLPPKQRPVGCIYYGFRSPAPLTDPILILNGEGSAKNGGERPNTKEYPINNVCFPSVVQRGYAPAGYELCSVTILEAALTEHHAQEDEEYASHLDGAVRRQLATWFPNYASDILDETKWVTKGLYVIPSAQPAHYDNGSSGKKDMGYANIHGGRDCSMFQEMKLPHGMFVCGDHMATSTLNGALESGVNAGGAVARILSGVSNKI